MPINKNFRTTWTKVGEHEGHSVRKSSEGSTTEIHGDTAGVDFSLCFGCEKCVTVCPTQVFAPFMLDDHHRVVDPINDDRCIRCLACPVEAISIEREGGSDDTLKSLLEGSY